jgi:hypothetical protein
VDTYSQGSGQRENVRNTGVYLFAQDSWKIKNNLTLNYGLRWELDTPLTDVLGHVQTFRPGQNSKAYPCTIAAPDANGNNSALAYCPTGLVVPGDPGVPAGMTSTYYKAFAPRLGLSYSPNFTDGFLGKLFGSNGKTSIRTGWGLFYNPMEQLVLEQFGAEPPFGSSPSFFNTFFNTPFVGQSGTVAPNGFNGILTPPKGQDPGWGSYSPILMYGDFQPHLRSQYTAQYNFSIQGSAVANQLRRITGPPPARIARHQSGNSANLPGPGKPWARLWTHWRRQHLPVHTSGWGPVAHAQRTAHYRSYRDRDIDLPSWDSSVLCSQLRDQRSERWNQLPREWESDLYQHFR